MAEPAGLLEAVMGRALDCGRSVESALLEIGGASNV
jgi:hypothetical protein